MKLVLQSISNNENYTAGCDYALIDLNKVEATFSGSLDLSFSDDGKEFEVTDSEIGGSEWDDDGAAFCYECTYEGTVAEFEAAEEQK